MKRTVSLFQFMPYGAPELLAAGRSHMARALVVSSVLPMLAFLSILPFVPMLRAVRVPERATQVTLYPDLAPPPIYVPPELPHVQPTAPPAGKQPAIPVPVPDTPAPTDIDDRPVTPDARPNDASKTGDPSSKTPTAPPPTAEVLPERGTYQYVEELPQPVVQFKPEYPDVPRQAGVDGLVVVHAMVGKDGRVMRVELDEKRNIPMLNATALEAAMKWKFTPALSNGHPVVCWYAIPFKFVLHE